MCLTFKYIKNPFKPRGNLSKKRHKVNISAIKKNNKM